MSISVFSFPTLIHFGVGARAKLAPFMKDRGARRPLVVTDGGVAEQAFFKALVAEWRAQGLDAATFAGVRGNPTRPQVNEGVAAYRAHGADSIVGIGGGAALDVAKAIALMASHPGDLFDYEDGKPGAKPIDRDVPLWVAVPTTAGTGSEVGRSTVISDETTHVKKIVFSPKLLARAVFADPELTTGLPPKITAATGMDALTHCVESFLARDFHPICDGIALEGLRLAARSLAVAVREPRDLGARSDMLLASMMGAIAFQKGLGLTHSCAHALSTVADLHHGLANGIMIDHALDHNAPAAPERFTRLAEVVGLQSKTAPAFLAWLAGLKAEIGVPARLSQAGISRDQLPRLAQLAFEDSCHQNNPRECTAGTFTEIFQRAY